MSLDLKLPTRGTRSRNASRFGPFWAILGHFSSGMGDYGVGGRGCVVAGMGGRC